MLESINGWLIATFGVGIIGVGTIVTTFIKSGRASRLLANSVGNLSKVASDLVDEKVLPLVTPFIKAGDEILVRVNGLLDDIQGLTKKVEESLDTSKKLGALVIALSPSLPAIKQKAIELFGDDKIIDLLKTSIVENQVIETHIDEENL